MSSERPWWKVNESTPIRDLIGQATYQLPDGNMKKIGGDIHSTVDINPNSETFGEVHSTMRIPGANDYHS